SKLAAGEKPSASAISPQLRTTSYVRIARLLSRTARMRDGAIARRPDLLGVFPQIPRSKSWLAGLPILRPRLKLARRQSDGENSILSVQSDHVAVAQECDRAANGSLRPDMADTEATRSAGEATISDQGHLAAHALAVQRRRGRQHLAHARTALGSFVADDEH